jgi:hypothetical protein
VALGVVPWDRLPAGDGDHCPGAVAFGRLSTSGMPRGTHEARGWSPTAGTSARSIR